MLCFLRVFSHRVYFLYHTKVNVLDRVYQIVNRSIGFYDEVTSSKGLVGC